MQTETCFKLKYFLSLTSCSGSPHNPLLKICRTHERNCYRSFKNIPHIKFLLMRKCFSFPFPCPDLILNVHSFVWSRHAILYAKIKVCTSIFRRSVHFWSYGKRCPPASDTWPSSGFPSKRTVPALARPTSRTKSPAGCLALLSLSNLQPRSHHTRKFR